MTEETKEAGAIGWIRSAKEKLRFLAQAERGGPKERTSVGLALAGGFARGVAHIGVLRVLRDAGIPIDCVAGTSVGALIGVGYCAGTSLLDMEKLGVATHFTDFGRWTPSWLGLATNQRMEKFLERVTKKKTFEELAVPLAIAATDINEGISVFYSHGLIAPALRASCAYPGLFLPIQHEGRTLVDGFVTAPVPIEGALLLGADIVIAVHLETGSDQPPRTFTEVLSRAFNIVQQHSDLAWRTQADVVIEPDVKGIAWDDFSKTPDMIAAGEAAALRALPEIRAALRGEKQEAAG
jgi:NTE family protein